MAAVVKQEGGQSGTKLHSAVLELWRCRILDLAIP